MAFWKSSHSHVLSAADPTACLVAAIWGLEVLETLDASGFLTTAFVVVDPGVLEDMVTKVLFMDGLVSVRTFLFGGPLPCQEGLFGPDIWRVLLQPHPQLIIEGLTPKRSNLWEHE